MKSSALIIASLLIVAAVLWLTTLRPNNASKKSDPRPHPNASEVPSNATELRTGTNKSFAASIPASNVRQKAYEARLKALERIGHVPEDADATDWYLAEKTSWWGKPLDPHRFWRDRTIWLDSSANKAARSYGRMFPPMPYDDPQLPTYPPGDVDTSGSASVEGPDLHFRWSSTEAAFWDRFVKTHPRPPEDIDREQSEIANKILTGRSYFEHRGNPARITASELARGEQLLVNNAVALGYPQEALTEEAFLWSYIRNNNEQFQTEKSFGLSQESPAITNFIHFLAVDPKFVTQPLTQSQLLEANRWKTAYLRRLRSESADDSYINAYVKTWNLSAKDIFGGAKVSQ